MNGDPKVGATNSNAPHVFKDKVITGISGGEFGVRGYIAAYNINDGKLVWKGHSMGPDSDMLMDPEKTMTWTDGKMAPVGKDSSLKTWQGDQWKIGGGTTWGWFSYDPALNLMYYGSGKIEQSKPEKFSVWSGALTTAGGITCYGTLEGYMKCVDAKDINKELGVFGNTPPVDWLLRNKLFDQAVPYQTQTGDPQQYPGEIIERDLVAGKIDVAFVRGPIAGYFAKKVSTPQIAVVPFEPDPQIHFDYAIAMGVRFGEREWKARVEQLIETNRPKIQAILAAYGVPQLDDSGNFIQVAVDPIVRVGAEPLPYRVVDGKVDQATYVGWRLFQTNCATCHGNGATGSDRGPNLLPLIKEMSAKCFVGTVLMRYKLVVPAGESGAREALIAEILERKAGDIQMPAWEGDPNVKPNIMDLYAYLRARADGALGEGRPQPIAAPGAKR